MLGISLMDYIRHYVIGESYETQQVAQHADGHKRFQSIPGTYKKFSLAMAMGMMYPNPGTERKRMLYLGLISGSFLPVYVMWFYDVTLCLRVMDLDNLTRQLSLGVPIMFCQFKMIMVTILRKQLQALFDEVNADYERYNYIGEDYQSIVQVNRLTLLRLERSWSCLVISTVSMFPLMAAGLTIYYHLFKEPKRFLVHELEVPFLGEARHDSPYFELLFTYMLYIAFILALCYLSYDGMFFVVMLHACLKMELICCRMSKVFEEVRDLGVVRGNIARVVEEQGSAFRFIDSIKKEYEIWLVLVFALTVVQLCMNMYQIITSTGASIDPRYIIFLVAAILHIYVPCYLVSQLSAAAVAVSDAAYCSGWERLADAGVRRSVCVVVARAQRPLQVQALNIITFNMELFVSVMQSSYSVFTLMRK